VTDSLDGVTTRVLWSRLAAIVDEAAVGLVRTAYSVVIRDFHDYCIGIFDRRGRMLVHSTRTTPGFIGMMPYVVDHFLTEYGEDGIHPGDILATNDPWIATGHNNDLTVATPIFRDDVLIGFAVCVVHHLDIGGRMGNLFSVDMYEEGLRLPILKLYQRGVPDAAIFKLIEANVRMSHKVLGDVDAQLAANEICLRGVLRMVEEYGLDGLEALATRIIDLSDRGMRRRIAEIPDGEYAHVLTIPAISEPERLIRLQVKVIVDGERVVIDYDGTSAEGRDAINCTFPFTVSYSVFAIKALIDPDLPSNAGSWRAIEVRAPAGSILNCRPPMPTYGRTYVAHMLPELILGALENAVGERIIAACGSSPIVALHFSGQHGSGERFLTLVSHMGGYGGSAVRDGKDTMAFPGNTATIPVEVIEHEAAILYHRRELLVDSAGPGKHRGGCGQRIVIGIPPGASAPTGKVRAVIRGAVRKPDSPFAVRGIAGGGTGRGGQITVNGSEVGNGTVSELSGDDRVVVALSGGGGYGDPFERDVDAVACDVADGLVSPEAAERDYGVKLSAEGLPLLPETRQLRERVPNDRAA
jgi:N-methylhydantoinase B/oxoprolinase/acetone carboxylase alpha subunit